MTVNISPSKPVHSQTLRRLIESVGQGNYVKALEALNHPGWAALETEFWNASHPMAGAARAAYDEYRSLALELWTRFGAGTVDPLTVYRQSLNSPAGIDALLRILGRLYAGCNLGYSAPPPGYWRTVFAITGFVVAQCRDGHEAAFIPHRNLCLQLWLMGWLNPLSLIAGRLPIAVRLVGLLSKSCTYSLAPPTHAGTGLAAADLASDRSPMPFSRIPLDWSPELPLYVNAQSAAYAIEALQASAPSVKSGDVYEALLGAGQAAGLTAPEVRDFVKRALREFGLTQSRSIPRVPSEGYVQIVVGMIEVWNVLEYQSHVPQLAQEQALFTTLDAQIINHSAGGFLLRIRSDVSRLRTGTLLAMCGSQAEPWTLCAIRWLQDNATEVLVGVEVLCNYPKVTYGYMDDGTHQAPVIHHEHSEIPIVYLPLGYADSQIVTQLTVGRELWVLSAVQELGDDWEMRSVLDVLPSTSERLRPPRTPGK